MSQNNARKTVKGPTTTGQARAAAALETCASTATRRKIGAAKSTLRLRPKLQKGRARILETREQTWARAVPRAIQLGESIRTKAPSRSHLRKNTKLLNFGREVSELGLLSRNTTMLYLVL